MGDQDTELVDLLLASTKAGKIEWKRTAEAGEYTTSIKGKNSIVLYRGRTKDEGEYFMVSVVNPEGEALPLISSIRYTAIKELFEAAERQTYKIDEIIADLVQDLKSTE